MIEELRKYAKDNFFIEDVPCTCLISKIPFILPMADNDMAYDSDELGVNILTDDDTVYPRNKFSYNNIYVPIDSSKPSYLLILSTERTTDTTAHIFCITWEE